jgi:hypothetical protein
MHKANKIRILGLFLFPLLLRGIDLRIMEHVPSALEYEAIINSTLGFRAFDRMSAEPWQPMANALIGKSRDDITKMVSSCQKTDSNYVLLVEHKYFVIVQIYVRYRNEGIVHENQQDIKISFDDSGKVARVGNMGGNFRIIESQ